MLSLHWHCYVPFKIHLILRTKKPAAIAPLLPLTFLVGYQADLAYGSKVNRIRAEAENILQYERDLTDCPAGLPSIASIDAGRLKAQVCPKARQFYL